MHALNGIAKVAKIINTVVAEQCNKFLQKHTVTPTMTKKKANRTQKSTLDTMPLTPPRAGGRTVPRIFIPYDRTCVLLLLSFLMLID